MGKSTWIVDPAHTLAEFSVRHMMISTVKGRFGKVEGSIVADPADLTGAQLSGRVEVASIDTGEPQREGHLRSPDFFDAENHPSISFVSREVTRDGDDYRVVGDLTIRGITRPVTWKVEFAGQAKDPWGNERIGLSAETRIDRRDFGLNWNALLEAGGVLVGEQVKIALHVEAIKQQ